MLNEKDLTTDDSSTDSEIPIDTPNSTLNYELQ